MHKVTHPGHMIDACVKGTMKWVPLAREIWHIEGVGCLLWNKLAPWRMHHTPQRELAFDTWEHMHQGRSLMHASKAQQNELPSVAYAPYVIRHWAHSVAYASLTHDVWRMEWGVWLPAGSQNKIDRFLHRILRCKIHKIGIIRKQYILIFLKIVPWFFSLDKLLWDSSIKMHSSVPKRIWKRGVFCLIRAFDSVLYICRSQGLALWQ